MNDRVRVSRGTGCGALRASAACANRRGALTVEMALTVPILLVLVFALMQFAYLNLLRNTMTNACFEAARKAIAPGSQPADAELEARRLLRPLGVNNLTVSVTPTVIRDDTPDVTVDLKLDLSSIPFLSDRWISSRLLQRSCTLKREALGR